MGELLIDVLSLPEEGLVGFTKNGEQVPLSAPTPYAVLQEGFPYPLEEENIFSRIVSYLFERGLRRLHPGEIRQEISEERQREMFNKMRQWHIDTTDKNVCIKLDDDIKNFGFARVQFYNLYHRRD